MEIRYRSRFRREFVRLPKEIKARAILVERVFRSDPFDARLKTHKLHGPLAEFYVFSVGYKHRIIFAFAKADIIEFYSIGKHDIYE